MNVIVLSMFCFGVGILFGMSYRAFWWRMVFAAYAKMTRELVTVLVKNREFPVGQVLYALDAWKGACLQCLSSILRTAGVQ